LFVSDPDTDYAALYDEAYYRGRGADPKVDYVGELFNPDESIRGYEWRGVLKRITSAVGREAVARGRWLDYGCGNGCLVRSLRGAGVRAVGCDDGWVASKARSLDIPVFSLSDVGLQQKFDIVTAIEVVEHMTDPVAGLRSIRALMNPGAFLFLTTGNLSPWAKTPGKWGYLVPEVHVSYFTPKALSEALGKAGFSPRHIGYGPGWTDIIRFKVLKNLGIRNRGMAEAAVPWSIVSRAINAKYRFTDHPAAFAVGEG